MIDPAALVDQEARKLAGFEGLRDDQLRGVQLRQGEIVSYDAGAKTATIRLGGDTTTSISGVPHLSSYTPDAADTGVWVAMIGTAPLLIGAIGSAGASSGIQVGRVAVNVNTGSATWSSSVSFSSAFPGGSTVRVIVSHDQGSAGTKAVIASAASISTSGFTAWIRSADSANFGGAATYNVSWIAKVE